MPDERLDQYYMDEYRKILGVEKVPEEVIDLHEETKLMASRAGMDTMTPQMILTTAMIGNLRAQDNGGKKKQQNSAKNNKPEETQPQPQKQAPPKPPKG